MSTYSDDFNRANETPIGGNWTPFIGTPRIASNQLYVPSAAAYYNLAGSIVTGRFNATVGSIYGLRMFGIASANDYYRVYPFLDGANNKLRIQHVVNGTPTTLGTSAALSSGYGTAVNLYPDKVRVTGAGGFDFTVDLPEYVGGYIGLGGYGAVYIDNFWLDPITISVSVSDVTDTTAVVTAYITGAEAYSGVYSYAAALSGVTPESGDYTEFTSPQTLTSLIPGSDYVVWVKWYAAAEDYELVETSEFTTLASYDFTDPNTKLALQNPGIIGVELGYFYGDTFDSIPITRQAFTEAKLSDDDLYMTFSGESFITRLDKSNFYGGRYDASGIPASTLFAEILDDIEFPDEGQWAYRLGEADCKVSAAGTKPLWTRAGYDYYHIDSAFDSIMVDIPIPPVSHREALTMLAVYCGAYVLHRSDGSLDIVASLDEPLDYHLDIDRIYDRPETINGMNIATIKGTLQSYSVDTVEKTIVEASVAVTDTNPDRFTIVHDPCAEGEVVLTGATLFGTPTYNTYSTVFEATPDAAGVFTATLTGKPVTIAETQFSRDYPNDRGDIIEYSNPIASDITLATEMYDRYYRLATALSYKFTMRDDAAVETGDRVYLDTLAEPDGIAVIVKEIRRSFNGGVDGEYVVVEDTEPV